MEGMPSPTFRLKIFQQLQKYRMGGTWLNNFIKKILRF